MATMTPEEIDAILAGPMEAPASPAPQGPGVQQPTEGMTSAEQDAAIVAAGQRGESPQPFQEPTLGDPSQPLEAALGGALKSTFETKDFLFGEPDTPSPVRAAVEGTVDRLNEGSVVNSLSSTIGQFGAAMLGAGKIISAARMVPGVGAAAARVSPLLAETAKAAAVGAVAFDPHEERLSNLFQGTALENPVTSWLAADPTDSAAEGRIKAALESIGMDAAVIGAFAAGTKLWKAIRSGDGDAVGRATKSFEETTNADQQQVPEAGPVQAAPEGTEVPPARAAGDGTPEPAPGQAALPDTGGVPPQAASQAADPVVTQNVTDAMARTTADGSEVLPQAGRIRPVAQEDMEAIVNGLQADSDAMATYGGWYQAQEAGHVFGRGEGVPWNKLNQPVEVDDFTARLADTLEDRLNRLKGGNKSGVLTDRMILNAVEKRALLLGEDPATLVGMIRQSGQAATRMVADMEAGYLLTGRMLQDTFTLANRYRLGDITGFESREAMGEALKKQMSMAADVYGNTRAMTAAAGRGLRRMRKEFILKPEDVAALNSLDPDQLATLVINSGGNPKQLAQLANPSTWEKLRDASQYLLVNNLVSGPTTQAVNITSNLGMLSARPMEKIMGGAINAARLSLAGDELGAAASGRVVKEAVKQYAYMGTSARQALSAAWKAFKINDSVLVPHNVELRQASQPWTAPLPWKPFDTPENLLSNVLLAVSAKGLWKGVGLPTRILGTVDELVKQTTYRSNVMARAHVDGTELGLTQGLQGKALADFTKTYVQDRLAKAFDPAGVALDPVARREAQIATFNQELLPGTWGKGIQNLTSTVPAAKFVLPFVRTPTNAIRYGWKLTPGLNLLQAEFRHQLTGKMGKELQAEAIGQMSLGVLTMTSIAFLASDGKVTGGGPSDPKQREQLMATGWRPYSYVSENEDGSKTYTSFGRFDPLAIPMGIVADIADSIEFGELAEDDPDLLKATWAVTLAMTSQFRSKTYFQNVNSAMDALLSDNEDGRGPQRFVGQMAGNMVPFSALMRQTSSDPLLREARSITDQLKANIPVLSPSIPAKYDAFGEPILARRGLTVDSPGSEVDLEVQRQAMSQAGVLTRPSPRVEGGVDLRDLKLSNGANAYEEYQRLAGRPTPRTRPLKDVVAKIIASPQYQRAPDGPIDVKGTKLWILGGPVSKYRQAALKQLQKDPAVRTAMLEERLKVRAAYEAQNNGGGPTPQAQSPILDGLRNLGQSFGINF